MLRLFKSISCSRALNTRRGQSAATNSLFANPRSDQLNTPFCIIYRSYAAKKRAPSSKSQSRMSIQNQLTEISTPEMNKIIDNRLVPQAKNPALMSKEDLLKAKYDKTPLTPVQESKVETDARRFVQLLMQPVETPVFKREMKLVTTDLNEFFEIYPRNEKTYNMFIRGLAAMGDYQKAKVALIDMRMQGLKPNVMVYTSLMTGCVASQDVDEAFRIFETILKEGQKPTDYTFSVLANVCVKSGQLNRAYSLVEMTKKYDIQASPVLYSSLIHGCLLEEQVDRAWQTWDHMRTWTGLVPDEVQYTLMINACTMREEAERALMLYDEMLHLKMQPTEVTYNSLLQCLSTRKDFYKDAFDVLEKMKNDGFAPDVYTLTLLLKTAARGGDAKTGELIFDQLMMIPEAVKQEHTYAWLIHGYSVAHRIDMTKTTPNIEKGTKIFQKMIENGVKPTNFTINQYLSLFTEALRLNRALEVMKTEFEKHALVPDDYAYNSLIKMFARVHKAERAIDMFNLMKAEKIEPNKATYTFLIDACTKSQLYTTGVNFLKEMKDKGFTIHWSEDFVIKFKASCGKLTQVAKEIDHITGKDRRWVPSFRKPGTRQFQKADRRELTEEDKKQLRDQGRVSSLFKDPLPNKI